MVVHSAGLSRDSSKKAVEYEIAHHLMGGMGFEKAFAAACIYAIGYNACYVGGLAKTRYRKIPEHGFGTELDIEAPIVDYLGNLYTYPIGYPVGIYLQDCDKMLGAGYDLDCSKCCSNAGLPVRGIHHYEIRPDGDIERWEQWPRQQTIG